MQWLLELYRNTVLEFPKITLAVAALIIALIAQGASQFELDASAESMVLENDQDLVNYRSISERFGSSEFLIVTYTPSWPLFSEQSLSLLRQIRNDLKGVPRIESINSLLDVPLLENPPVPITELVDNIKNLDDMDVDVEAAQDELANSPLYNNMLLNLERNTTAIQLNRPADHRHRDLTKAREALWNIRDQQGLSQNQQGELIGADQRTCL